MKITRNIKSEDINTEKCFVKEYRFIDFHSDSWYRDFEIVYTPLHEHTQFVETLYEEGKLVGAYFKVKKEFLTDWPKPSSTISFSDKNILIKLNSTGEWIFRKVESRGWKESYTALCDKTIAILVEQIDSEEELIQEYNSIFQSAKFHDIFNTQKYHW